MSSPQKAEFQGLERYRNSLQQDQALGLRRSLREIQSPQGRLLRSGEKEYLNFSSNNYLGLAEDPGVRQAFQEGLVRFGVGSGASRLINGSMSPFHELEYALAEFKGTEASLVFNSGYHANLGALHSLVGPEDVVFSDALNHASLIDGIRLSRAQKIIYRHGDLKELRSQLETRRPTDAANSTRLIVTESIFSMDGDACRLGPLLDLAHEFDALLYLDEAHATGVFGNHGAGLAEEYRDHPAFGSHLVQMGTLGKALGCFGAYIAGPRVLTDFLINRARTFIFTTALPPAVAQAALESLKILREHPERRKTLWQRIEFFKSEWKRQVPQLECSVQSPIVPLVIGDLNKTLDLSEFLRERGFWVTAIRPPTVPDGTSRLRITLMATHTEEDIRHLIRALREGIEGH